MGLAMYRLATLNEMKACSSAAEFARRVGQRTFSAEFLCAWDHFIQAYGHRSLNDLDIASPRFYEVPGDVYRQLRTMALNTDTENNPLAMHEKGKVKWQETFEFLLEIQRGSSKRKATKLSKCYNVLVTFDGYREIHKYYIFHLESFAAK